MKQSYLSSSNLTDYLNCPRKAALVLKGIKAPSNAAQTRGSELHLALERYLKGQTETVEDALGDFARQLGLLPKPCDPRVKIEFGLGMSNAEAARYADVTEWSNEYHEIGGFPVYGMVDLIRTDRGCLEIIDHKTTANFYFAETDESLRHNAQLWLYAALVISWANKSGWYKVESNDTIYLTHIQYATKVKPSFQAVKSAGFKTTASEVSERALLIRGLLELALDDAHLPLNHVYADRSHCSAYGGCPYKPFCAHIDNDASKINPKSAQARAQWSLK